MHVGHLHFAFNRQNERSRARQGQRRSQQSGGDFDLLPQPKNERRRPQSLFVRFAAKADVIAMPLCQRSLSQI